MPLEGSAEFQAPYRNRAARGRQQIHREPSDHHKPPGYLPRREKQRAALTIFRSHHNRNPCSRLSPMGEQRICCRFLTATLQVMQARRHTEEWANSANRFVLRPLQRVEWQHVLTAFRRGASTTRLRITPAFSLASRLHKNVDSRFFVD